MGNFVYVFSVFSGSSFEMFQKKNKIHIYAVFMQHKHTCMSSMATIFNINYVIKTIGAKQHIVVIISHFNQYAYM